MVIAHQRRLVRPWLPRTHPNFFIIYTCALIYHVWAGLLGIFGSDQDFAGSGLLYVRQLGTHQEWGYLSLAIGLALYLGIHCRTFEPARYALAAGLAITAARWVCILIAWAHHAQVGYAPPVYFLICGLHVSQVREPPVNPETGRA